MQVKLGKMHAYCIFSLQREERSVSSHHVFTSDSLLNTTMKTFAALVLLLLLTLSKFSALCCGQLQVGFYKGKCGKEDVEGIIRRVVNDRFNENSTITPALLRMQFHDCFVKGCDASILLDGQSTEKNALPNLSVRGYDVIDQAKAAVDKACPGVVSCADIIVAAARDAISLSGGLRYEVQTGRRDGLVSLASNVNLPSPSLSVAQTVAAFAKKGLNSSDTVLLLGGHTIGITHCIFFIDRLYNFTGTGKPDPSMDPALLTALRMRCPRNATNGGNEIDLDQNPQSAKVVDNDYYKQIMLRRGVLQIDQELALDPLTREKVRSLALGSDFQTQFAKAMVKLGAVEVLTGKQGEIRKSCRSINGGTL